MIRLPNIRRAVALLVLLCACAGTAPIPPSEYGSQQLGEYRIATTSGESYFVTGFRVDGDNLVVGPGALIKESAELDLPFGLTIPLSEVALIEPLPEKDTTIIVVSILGAALVAALIVALVKN